MRNAALFAALCLAALAQAAMAQTVQSVPTRPDDPRIRRQGTFGIQGIQVQRADLPVACGAPDLVECAKTDSQRRGLLMSDYGGKLTDEQWLRLIAQLENVQYDAGSNSPLSTAIAAGRSRAVAALLDKGADPLAKDSGGNLLLNSVIDKTLTAYSAMRPEVLGCLRLALAHAAKTKRLPATPPLDASLAFRGRNNTHPELIRLLLEYGADPAFKGKHGRPIDLALTNEQPELLRTLVSAPIRIEPAELDARAFALLDKGKPELLEALRAGGADPTRYARNNPQALFDALRPERGSEVLELTLKAGADPNAAKPGPLPILPLFEARFDPEKLRLLLKYGADPNVKDYNRYTLLAQVLFSPNREIAVPSAPVPGRETRRYPKIELVRLLLDCGAKVNGDHGGWGRDGALGLARREDKDVIALLLDRGATLTAAPRSAWEIANAAELPRSTPGGPLTIAIEMERDDLALALLAHDRQVQPQDRPALLLAAQRGWREVVAALLKAGADPNAADAQGWTALAKAERRRDAAMAKMLVDAGAKPAVQPARRPVLNAGGEFATAVAGEIDDVVFFDPPRFALAGTQKASFAFYGKESNQLEQATCERGAGFGIIASANMAGGISTGICVAEAQRVRELAQNSEVVLGALLGRVSQGGSSKPDGAELARMGWSYAKKVTPNGTEEHYFPLLVIGHGVLYFPTVVLVPRGARQAIVVQADTMRLCENYGLQTQTPLCSDTREALSEIARRLEARFAEK